jgi:hypothetical protein
MRTEQEVRQMIAELEQSADPRGRTTAQVVIAALRNVLEGPTPIYGDKRDWCCCLGPTGCCPCRMRQLALPDEMINSKAEGPEGGV